MGIMGNYHSPLSNEELFAKADFAAAQYEKYMNVKLSPEEYRTYVRDWIKEYRSGRS